MTMVVAPCGRHVSVIKRNVALVPHLFSAGSTDSTIISRRG